MAVPTTFAEMLATKLAKLKEIGLVVDVALNEPANNEDVFSWVRFGGVSVSFTTPEETLDKLDRLIGA